MDQLDPPQIALYNRCFGYLDKSPATHVEVNIFYITGKYTHKE